MTARDTVSVAAFLLCFLVLFSPLLGWYVFFVIGDPFVAPTNLDKAIAGIFGARTDTFNLLSVFMAPIGVLVATNIARTPNSPLIYISVPFIIAFVLAVMAPWTVTPTISNEIPGLLNSGNAESWTAAAKVVFGRYAESFASTSAVLLGLQLRGT